MEKFRVSNPQGHQGIQGTKGTHRNPTTALEGATGATGGDFLSLLSALGNNLGSGLEGNVLPVSDMPMPAPVPVVCLGPFQADTGPELPLPTDPPVSTVFPLPAQTLPTDLTTLLAWQNSQAGSAKNTSPSTTTAPTTVLPMAVNPLTKSPVAAATVPVPTAPTAPTSIAPLSANSKLLQPTPVAQPAQVAQVAPVAQATQAIAASTAPTSKAPLSASSKLLQAAPVAQPTQITVATPPVLPMAFSVPGAPLSMGLSKVHAGVSGASGGGELGLVAQTAAQDGALEIQTTQGLAPAAPGSASTFASGPRRGSSTASSVGSMGTATTAGTTAAQRFAATEHPSFTHTPVTVTLAQAMMERHESTVSMDTKWMATHNEGGASSVDFAGSGGLGLFSGTQGLAQGERGSANSGRGDDKSGSAGAGAGAQGAIAPPTEFGFTEVAPVPSETLAAPDAEEAIADQIAQWASDNIQNAELTIDHGGQPVEVSVTLTGKEAHVSFRSDESQTRDLLDSSAAQLRELLHSQGLELSGMTVGHSGAGAQGDSSSSDNTGGRRGNQQNRGSTSSEAPIETKPKPRPAIVTDRAVDIFV